MGKKWEVPQVKNNSDDKGCYKIDKEYLQKLIEESLDFFKNEESVNRVLDNFYKYKDLLFDDEFIKNKSIAFMGVGYPFYRMHHDNEILPEIKDFHLGILRKLMESNLGASEWRCVKCQTENNLPDYKSACENCKKVNFKPRDIMKLLVDVDVFVVVNPDNDDELEKILEKIEKKSHDNRFMPSDISIGDTLKDTYEYLNGNSEKSLPIDSHVVDKNNFIEYLSMSLEDILDSEMDVFAMYNGWKKVGVPMSFDLLFSVPLDVEIEDDELKNKIEDFYKQVINKYDSFEKFVGLLSSFGDRAYRLTQDDSIKKELFERYDKLKKI